MELGGVVDQQFIFIIAGCLFLFGGWTLYWFSLNLAGAILVGGGFLAVAATLIPAMELEPGWEMAFIVGAVILGALLGVILFRFLHTAAFFLAGAAAGILIYLQCYQDIPFEPFLSEDKSLLLGIGVPGSGILAGGIAVILGKYLIMMVSAIVGAVLLAIGLDLPYGGLLIPVFALGGGVFQWLIAGRKVRRRVEEE